jgi:hypothetical protein
VCARVRMWVQDGLSCGVGWAGCGDCMHPVCVCGCVRLGRNGIKDEGCAALAGALVHVPSLRTLEYVGCGVCVWRVCGV